MKRLRKVLLILVCVLLIATLLVAGTGAWLVRRAWPETSGTLAVRGLAAPVEIRRDQWGVPHIQAANEPDMFFAQGYVHAQDRLWQMEFGRRAGSGTLSAVLGDSTIDIDRYTRTLGLRRAAQKDWDQLDEESRSFLQHYAAGVNAYIDTHTARLPVEFTILSYHPEPWSPIDTLTWGKLLGLNLSGDYGLDLIRARVVGRYGLDKTRQVLPLANPGAKALSEL